MKVNQFEAGWRYKQKANALSGLNLMSVPRSLQNLSYLITNFRFTYTADLQLAMTGYNRQEADVKNNQPRRILNHGLGCP